MRNPEVNATTPRTCLKLKDIIFLLPTIDQSDELNLGLCLSNHGTVIKEPIESDPRKVTSTEIVLNKSKERYQELSNRETPCI